VFGQILGFEIRYLFKRPAVYFFAAIMFLMAFSAVATDSVQMGGAIGNAARNSPFEIVRLLSMMSMIGMIAITGFVASAVNRDHELATDEMFFATPVSKASYLFGRFAGALLAAFFAVCMSAPAVALASLMPWQDPERILPFNVLPYLYALGVFVLPTLFLGGAILFAFATLTKRVLFTYVAMIGVLMAYALTQIHLGDLESRGAAALLDPFGVTTFNVATRYWTVVEKNTLLPAFEGALMMNRALWTAVGVGFLGLTWWRFRMAVGERRSRVRPTEPGVLEIAGRVRSEAVALPMVTQDFSRRGRVQQWIAQTRVDVMGVLKSVPFIVILIFGMFNLAGSLGADVGGRTGYPVTREMLSMIAGTFELFLFVVLLVFAGQLAWRERAARMHEIHDSMPVPDWIPLTSKLTGLVVISGLALAVAMGTTIVYQLAKGYTNLEIPLYLRGLFAVSLAEWVLIAALAISVQTLTNNKIAGFVIMVVYFVGLEVLPSVDLTNNMYIYGTTPPAPYSDMNGYGHFVQPLVWYNIYWGFLAAALVLVSSLFWIRGTDNPMRLRLREAARRLTPGRTVALVALLVGFAATGAWIHRNTHVVNEYETGRSENALEARYEREYKQYDGLPQPRITDVRLSVDIYPSERRVEIAGDLTLVNKTDVTIEELHVLNDRMLEVVSMSLPDDAIKHDDREVGYRIYALGRPLAPGDTLDVAFAARITNEGFVDGRSNTRVVENGTFLDNSHCVPIFGYLGDRELSDPHERRKHGLPEREHMAPPDDIVARGNTFTVDADWITYEATLSTAEDQIAITAGNLEREWVDGGRRHFHYVMDTPMLHFFPVVSGRYEVARATWNDVEIAVYHHPAHTYNVGRMIESIEQSLDYYTANYSPYQHRQIRVVEFPRYSSFAQSFATTIPYSESAHFIDDLRNEEDLDLLFYVTAHEVAHQWWGHQVVVAWVQGATFIEESMAQYSALMVMEKNVGRERMKKFLAYELDRYLSGRGREREEERPLVTVENQGYIHYRKGSLAMYALRDYVGEERLNEALRDYIGRVAYQEPPYTNSLEFVEALREAAPESLDYLIEDLFETITLYDNRAEEATVEETENGRYRVRLAVQSRKVRADGRGVETEVPHEDWIEIGVFGERSEGEPDGKPLYLEKHRLASGSSAIEVVVDERPVRAGIDPRNLLIDRVPSDNVRRVTG